jgi:hypothetical protein
MAEFLPSIVVRLIVLLALACTQAFAAPLTAEVQWKNPSSVQLEVDFPGNGYHASWDLHRCACGDLLIRSELSVPGGVSQGEILLVANRAVLIRGYSGDAAAEISFDAPALMMQLALRLLERAEPAGPSAISERRQVDVEDPINHINLDTGAAAGGFPPPWRVQGAIWPQAETQRRFDLAFTFNAAGATGGEQDQGRMKLAGVAEYGATEFPLAEDMQLKGWDLSWRDENEAAAEAAKKAGTLAELRQLLSTP